MLIVSNIYLSITHKIEDTQQLSIVANADMMFL